MNKKTKDKLNKILDERKKNLKSIREFDDLFYKFSRETLKNTVFDISEVLEDRTDDCLRIYKDDPMEFASSHYFVMVVLKYRSENRMDSFKSDETNPSLKFEGKEINGEVLVSQRLIDEKKYKKIGVFQVIELTDEKTAELLVNFIECVFK